jgi:hypothetical protein
MKAMRARVRGRFAVPDFELEAFLCDDLPPERRAEIERASLADAALSAYLTERGAARARFAAEHPLRSPASEPTLARETAALRAARRWLLAAALAAPALALALWWNGARSAATRAPSFATDADPAARDTIRIKGDGLTAALYVKRGERVFRPQPDERLKAGDRVRLSIETAHAGYLTLLARDERGAVSVYYDRLPVQPGRFTVPDSLLLDDAPGDELWLVLLASEPRNSDEHARAFAAGQVPDAPHVVFTLRKEKP